MLALIDIDQLRRAREFAESVVESVKRPLLVLRSDLRVRMANRSFRESYSLQSAEIQNQLLFDIGRGQWNIPALRNALEQLSASQEAVKVIELEQECAGSGRRTLLINAHRVQPDGENQILVAVDDITAQKREEQILIDERERLKVSVESGELALHESEAALLRSRNELRALSAMLLHTQAEERRRVSRELHDDLSQKMAKLQFDLERLEEHPPPNLKEVKRRLAIARGGVEALSNDVRRIAYELHPAALDHLGLVRLRRRRSGGRHPGAARPGRGGRRIMKPVARVAPLLLALFVLAACGSRGKDDPILSLSAAESLAEGKRLMADERWSQARPYLSHAFEVEPNSAAGREALLLVADSLFFEKGEANLIQAEAKYRDFQNRFPTSDKAPYVQFQIANALAQRIERPDRDQASTAKALTAYEDLQRLSHVSL